MRVRSRPRDITEAVSTALQADEIGFQIHALLHGEPIVDVAAGTMGGPSDAAVGVDTLFPIFSVSKAITATALHLQAERGLVDYDAPVATYWPEYGNRGKERITLRHVLTHRAGVPQMPENVSPEQMTDWDWMTERLAEMDLLYEPGTHNTYLSMVFGWIIGEVVRRTDPHGRDFPAFVREEICGPLGMDAFYFGIPPELTSHVATLSLPDPPAPPPPGSPALRAVPPQVLLTPAAFNRTDVHLAAIPAVGGISNARSVARFFAMIAGRGQLDGVRLLSEDRVLSFLTPRSDANEIDETYGRVMPVGAGGFWLKAPDGQAEGRILAHTAAGGSLGWADLDTGLAVAFTHNRMNGRGLPLLSAAVHAAAGERAEPDRAGPDERGVEL